MNEQRRENFWDGKVVYILVAAVLVLVLLARARIPMLQPMASDFSLPVVGSDGRPGPDRLRLADQRGKVVLLDFWATWCRPCAVTTPILARVSQRYQNQGLLVVGVNVDQNGPELVPMFSRRFGLDYTVVYDSGAVMSQYNVQGLPTLILVDREGRIRRRHTGVVREQDLSDEIQGLL
jgi:cytochrome c biogenesis protein CcmG, thiol:disulfide interchange protein DsbE